MTLTMNLNTSAAAKKAFETVSGNVPVIGQMLGVLIELFWPGSGEQSEIDDIWSQLQEMNVTLNLAVVGTDVNTIESDINASESMWEEFLTSHELTLPTASDDTQAYVASLTDAQCQDIAWITEQVCLKFVEILAEFHKAPPEYLTGHIVRLGNLHLMMALLQRECWERIGKDLKGLDENIKNWALLYSVFLRACICRTRYVRIVKKEWCNAAKPNGVVTLGEQRDRFEIVPDIDGNLESLKGGDYPNSNKGRISFEPATTVIVDNHLIQTPDDSGGTAGSIVFMMAEGYGFDPNVINNHVDKLTRYAERAIYYWLDNGIILDSLIAWETRAMKCGVDAGQLAYEEQQALQKYLNSNCHNGIPYYLPMSGAGAWNDGVLSCPAIADPMNNDPTCKSRLGKWTFRG
ncbi:MAG TPA: hypothetical protein VLR90_20970, partial [Blastocatellia bacterium]|nr:hypothetical protein [Blastocatellia bacterium]